ncbi:DUF5117 domain-containing protein, partial [Reichenbachiella sp.]
MKLNYLLIPLAMLCTLASAQKKKKNKPSQEAVSANNSSRVSGFIDYSLDESQDRILLHVSRLEEEFLYLSSLSSGVGSNDIGLDRGKLNEEQVVRFVKFGNKLLLIQSNYSFRAISDNPDETRAVREAFAQSVIWGFYIEEEINGVYTVDATSFFVRDAASISQTLSQTKQGNYNLDLTRSALNYSRIKNFPKNSEFDAFLTFVGEPKGDWINSVTPSPEAVTVAVHHSFVALPDSNYQPRKFDPRAGLYGIEYYDFATPIGEPLNKKFVNRHRLVKKNPSAAKSEAVEPIVYYLDRGA